MCTPSIPAAASSSQIPHERFFDARETRSSLIRLPQMICEGFDPKTGELSLSFQSQEDYNRAYQIASVSQASMGQFALATQSALTGGAGSNIPTSEWTEKALVQTIAQIEKEHSGAPKAATSKKDRALAYQRHAQQKPPSLPYEHLAASTDKAKKASEKSFETLIVKMKKEFAEVDIYGLFGSFHEATHLHPQSFKPYYFPLCLAPCILEHFKTNAQDMVKRAYDQSPLLTFNTLTGLLCFASKIDSRFTDLILSVFPEDLIIYSLINGNLEWCQVTTQTQTKEAALRHQFCTHLAQGLDAVRNKDFKTARKCFSESSFYHISDQRPYMYKALIDLYTQDISSATKLIISVSQVVQWQFQEERLIAATKLEAATSGTKDAKPPPLPIRSETPLLSVLLSICNLDRHKLELDEKLSNAFSTYLDQPDVDLTWATLAVDVYQNHLSRLYDDELTPEHLSFINKQLNAELICASFRRLPKTEQEKHNVYVRIEDSMVVIQPSFIMDQKKPSLSMNEVSLELTDESRMLLLHDIVIDRSNAVSLNMIKKSPVDIFSFVNNEIKISECEPIFLSLVEAINQRGVHRLISATDSTEISKIPKESAKWFIKMAKIERLAQKDTLEKRLCFIRWAQENKADLSTETRILLTEKFFKWSLEASLANRPSLNLVTHQWLKSIEHTFTGSHLEKAHRAWGFIQEKKLVEAASIIKPFFDDWKDQIFNTSVDLDALKTLCMIKALVENPDIAKNLPFAEKDPIHLELIASALTILARNAVPYPYVIPSGRLTKTAAKSLTQLYVGAHFSEDDASRLKRQIRDQVINLNDLRQACKQVDIFAGAPIDPSDPVKWFIPSTPENTNLMRALIDDEIKLTQDRCVHNNAITEQEKQEKNKDKLFLEWERLHPTIIQDYYKNKNQVIRAFKDAHPLLPQEAIEKFRSILEGEQNKLFLEWMHSHPTLIQDYCRNTAEVMKAFSEAHPSLPKEVIAEFQSILKDKAAYQAKIEYLKPVDLSKKQDVRFWQLVKETSKLIHTVMKCNRSEEEHGLIVETEKDAQIVQQLIQEWSFQKPTKNFNELNENFHGPETHFIGKAPFIPHFNAGVIKNGSPVNVHIFFQE